MELLPVVLCRPPCLLHREVKGQGRIQYTETRTSAEKRKWQREGGGPQEATRPFLKYYSPCRHNSLSHTFSLLSQMGMVWCFSRLSQKSQWRAEVEQRVEWKREMYRGEWRNRRWGDSERRPGSTQPYCNLHCWVISFRIRSSGRW